MFPSQIRIIVIVLAIIDSIYEYTQGKDSWFLYLAGALILINEHFKGGSIWLAFQAYRKQNFEKVRKYIEATPKPEWLRPSSKAYYNFLSGVISTIDKDYKTAKKFFLQAADGNLRTDHLKCVTYCILADTSLHLNELDEAAVYFEAAKKIPHRDEINSMFEDLEKRINQ